MTPVAEQEHPVPLMLVVLNCRQGPGSDTSCFDFGTGPACAALCAADAFDAPCTGGGTCTAVGTACGVRVPEGGTLPGGGGEGGIRGSPGGTGGRGGRGGIGGHVGSAGAG